MMSYYMDMHHGTTALWWYNGRTPDFGPRGPRFETREGRTFHDLEKVSEY
jgi:hypothetical protein